MILLTGDLSFRTAYIRYAWVGVKNSTSAMGTEWRTEKCGYHLCLSSLKIMWGNCYLYMPSWGGTNYRLVSKLYHWEDVCSVDTRWMLEFDVLCDNWTP